MRFVLALCALLLLPTAANAEWFEASSAHFVVYANDSEKDVREFSEQLERYHEAMAIVTGMDEQAPPSPSNRVTVYMIKASEVQRMAGSQMIGGFYIPRAGGSVAFVPRVEVKTGAQDWPMIALLHEYAHHFLLSGSRFPSPRWYGEGGAEFFASVEFARDGHLGIGRPAYHRGGELAWASNVTATELVDVEAYEKKPGNGAYDAFYGKSWLLYHYLVFSPERKGQLRGYMEAMMGGKTSREAAEQVFGDLRQLEKDLQDYLKQKTIMSMRFRPDQLEIAPVALRRLTEGEAAMMRVRIRSDRGVTTEQALDIVKDAREVAAKYPNDAAVLTALSEAEVDAGNDAEAIAAADRAIAIDPSQVNAYVQKGLALFRRAAESEAEDPVPGYREAVAPFLALNKLENDHPLPLIFYFRSFVESGRTPTEAAVLGLERAAELAPFDLGLQTMVAVHQLSEGRLDQARAYLVPVAYSPHPSPASEGARAVIERIDSGSAGDSQELLQLLAGATGEEKGEAATGG